MESELEILDRLFEKAPVFVSSRSNKALQDARRTLDKLLPEFNPEIK